MCVCVWGGGGGGGGCVCVCVCVAKEVQGNDDAYWPDGKITQKLHSTKGTVLYTKLNKQ